MKVAQCRKVRKILPGPTPEETMTSPGSVAIAIGIAIAIDGLLSDQIFDSNPDSDIDSDGSESHTRSASAIVV